MSLCLQGEIHLPQLPPTTHSTAEAGLLGQRRPQLLPQHWSSAGSSCEYWAELGAPILVVTSVVMDGKQTAVTAWAGCSELQEALWRVCGFQ